MHAAEDLKNERFGCWLPVEPNKNSVENVETTWFVGIC